MILLWLVGTIIGVWFDFSLPDNWLVFGGLIAVADAISDLKGGKE